jgi:hypothetical protein
VTTDETFLWYHAQPRLQVGLAHLWKQNAFRYLASYNLSPETVKLPAVNVSAGVQGIGTGNPGYSAVVEKNFAIRGGSVNVFAGLGWRTNENRAREVAGAKFEFSNGITVGLQDDGKQRSPFATFTWGHLTSGLYWVGGKNVAYLLGARF